MQEQLHDVSHVQSTAGAFAALASGSVVAWGDLYRGGDIPTCVKEKLNTMKVIELQASSGAFAALSSTGTVVW